MQTRFFQTNNKRKGCCFINYDIIIIKKKRDNNKDNFDGTVSLITGSKKERNEREMNPTSVMKIMSMKNEFNRQHPKFAAFIKAVMAKGVQEGSVVEITVRNPGEEEMTANIKVQASDLELLREIKELMG